MPTEETKRAGNPMLYALQQIESILGTARTLYLNEMDPDREATYITGIGGRSGRVKINGVQYPDGVSWYVRHDWEPGTGYHVNLFVNSSRQEGFKWKIQPFNLLNEPLTSMPYHHYTSMLRSLSTACFYDHNEYLGLGEERKAKMKNSCISNVVGQFQQILDASRNEIRL
ncbi:hypothetical protein TWF730_002018 [Orbilia blumenaviensis]|uniref:Uncharacterized protein n=1 Tax=Orbilia blumenaviensis TaxID=1796055 RepID=A0AAV9UDG0_9PEZI